MSHWLFDWPILCRLLPLHCLHRGMFPRRIPVQTGDYSRKVCACAALLTSDFPCKPTRQIQETTRRLHFASLSHWCAALSFHFNFAHLQLLVQTLRLPVTLKPSPQPVLWTCVLVFVVSLWQIASYFSSRCHVDTWDVLCSVVNLPLLGHNQ